MRIHSRSTPDDLTRAATPRTRGVMLNSPTNPTGAVYSLDELRAILDLAEVAGLVGDQRRDLPRDQLRRGGPVAARRRRGGGVAARPARRRGRSREGVRDDGLAHRLVDRADGRGARDLCSAIPHDVQREHPLAARRALRALVARQSAAAIARMVAEFRRRRDAARRCSARRAWTSSSRAARSTCSFACRNVEATPIRARRSRASFSTHATSPSSRGGLPHAGVDPRLYAAPMEDVLEGVRRIVDLVGR